MSRQNIPEEWETFQRNARRFPDETKERRYGILNPSVSNPKSDADMLYAADPRTLHNMHWDNWPCQSALHNIVETHIRKQ